MSWNDQQRQSLEQLVEIIKMRKYTLANRRRLRDRVQKNHEEETFISI